MRKPELRIPSLDFLLGQIVVVFLPSMKVAATTVEKLSGSLNQLMRAHSKWWDSYQSLDVCPLFIKSTNN